MGGLTNDVTSSLKAGNTAPLEAAGAKCTVEWRQGFEQGVPIDQNCDGRAESQGNRADLYFSIVSRECRLDQGVANNLPTNAATGDKHRIGLLYTYKVVSEKGVGESPLTCAKKGKEILWYGEVLIDGYWRYVEIEDVGSLGTLDSGDRIIVTNNPGRPATEKPSISDMAAIGSTHWSILTYSDSGITKPGYTASESNDWVQKVIVPVRAAYEGALRSAGLVK